MPYAAAPARIEMLEPRRLMTVSGPLFGVPISTPVTFTGATTVATGDLDGDGKFDLAVVHGSYHDERQPNGTTLKVFSGQIRFFGGDGAGHFSKAIGNAVTLDVEPKSIVVDDFNEDGRADLALSLGSNRAAMLLGTGKARFAPLIQYASVDVGAGQVVKGDFNGDGNIDLAISGQRILGIDPGTGRITGTESEIAVHLGTGTGLLSNAIVTRISGSYQLSLATGDFDEDGTSDLAVGGKSGVQLLVGKGDGTFSFPGLFATSNAGNVVVADFNGDHHPDVAWLRTATPGTVEYAPSVGKAKYGAVETLRVSAGGVLGSLVAGDIDGDGWVDLVAGPNSVGNGYFVNEGGGGFLEVHDEAGAKPALTGDFNRDGRMDVLSSDLARVYLAAVQPTPPVYLSRKGTLVVTGTRRNFAVNLVVSGSRIATTVNGQTWTSRLSRVKRVQIVTGAGSDRIIVDGSVFSTCLISAGGDNDTVQGGAGNDTIQGDNGNDNLHGGRGVDVIQGGKGNDTVNGGKGVDQVFGNAGRDTFAAAESGAERVDFDSGSDLLD
jgi:Ca2+-binding RTX toxin-like protein